MVANAVEKCANEDIGVCLRNSIRIALLSLIVAAPLAAETRLGAVSQGQVLRLRVDNLPPLSRILIRIDGDDVDVPLAYQDGYLLVSLPDDLPGVAHDLVVLRRQPDVDMALQTFTFEIPAGQVAYAFSGTVEAGGLSAASRSTAYVTGNARLSFEFDRGRVTGGVTAARGINFTTGEITNQVSDYFLQRRTVLWGDDLTVRAGSQFFEDELPIFDGAARAGLSLRLTDADQRYETTAFATQASTWDSGRSALGLGDPADRLSGLKGYVFPFAGRGLKLTYAGFSGNVPSLPSGKPGVNEGWAGSFSLPFAQDRGSLMAALAQTSWDDGTVQKGRALTIEASVLATQPGDTQSLTLTARHARVDAGYFSALNPDLIADEARSEIEAAWYAPQFQATLTAAHALNDIADDPAAPTDRFREATLDLFYSPQDFTGGFWNGTSVNLTLHTEDQHRVETPAGAAAASDNRFDSFAVGIDHFRAETAWALRYSQEQLTDLTGGGSGQKAKRVEALYAYTLPEAVTVNLSARQGWVEQRGSHYKQTDVSASLWKQLIPDHLSAEIGVGALISDVPADVPGRYLSSEVAWEFLPDHEIVLSADYGNGSKANYLTDGGGWVFGLAYRQDFGLFQRN